MTRNEMMAEIRELNPHCASLTNKSKFELEGMLQTERQRAESRAQGERRQRGLETILGDIREPWLDHNHLGDGAEIATKAMWIMANRMSDFQNLARRVNELNAHYQRMRRLEKRMEQGDTDIPLPDGEGVYTLTEEDLRFHRARFKFALKTLFDSIPTIDFPDFASGIYHALETQNRKAINAEELAEFRAWKQGQNKSE